MKTLTLVLFLAFIPRGVFAKEYNSNLYRGDTSRYHNPTDSVKLQVDNGHVYYQKVEIVDSNITESKMYIRALQFMASKNIPQTYGYEEEGKIIFATTQDLNVNIVYVGDDNEVIQPYTVQFGITLDLKNGRFRYTINNVVFFVPADNGNKRETLDEVYIKATNKDSRRVAKEANKLIVSFERYISKLANELYDGIEQKSEIYKPNF